MSALPGINVMLEGPSGVGKTFALRTLIAKGITPMCVFTEPGFEVLGDVPGKDLHWHYVKPADQSWASMTAMAERINQLSFDGLTKISDPDKRQYNQWIDLLASLNNFKCDRTGEVFGDCYKWGTDRAIVLDGLSGASLLSMNLAIGAKPTKHQGEWGVAMDNLERLIQKLCFDTFAHFILIAHIERELDEVLGGTKIMASTLGKKLAPKLPRLFSDVILARRTGTQFSWSTADTSADLKARNLPVAEGIAPDFGPMIEHWKKQGGVVGPAPDTQIAR